MCNVMLADTSLTLGILVSASVIAVGENFWGDLRGSNSPPMVEKHV
jgi:hypothetical protein